MTDILRYAAFSTDPGGGNPAGVVLDAGDDLGRPGRLTVTLVPGEAGVRVSGTAVPIPH